MKTKGKIFVFVLLVILLAIVMFLSLSIGAKSFSFSALLEAFTTQNESFEFSVIQQRLPRTIFGVLAGASLAVSGCLMQNITRNPIADPGILGVNSGAALFVVCGISFFRISGPFPYIVLGFLGALLTSFLVYGIASSGMGATPLKLVLAGAAVSIALQSIISMITMPNTQVMDTFRFWQTGSISGADWSSVRSLLFCFGIGMVLSFALAHSLNMISLGDELATGLGVRVQKTRAIAALAGVLLCASVTALAGPIAFVGLMIPHVMRLLCGNNLFVLLPFSAVGGGILLLVSDILGRVLLAPSQLEVGIVTALLGAPVFIGIVRKAKVKGL